MSFQLFGDPEELAIYRELADGLQGAQRATVNLIEVGDRKDHLAKLTASIAARRSPDVFLVNYRNMGGYAGARRDRPGRPAHGRARRPGARRVLPGRRSTRSSSTGELQCVPQNASSLVVYYNRDLFATAGLQAPRAGWSFAEFVAAAKQAHAAAA